MNDRKVFLQNLSPNRKKLLHDKLECATLFSSKASYQSTIPHIYRNDYLGMHAEAKWLDIRNKNQFSPSQVFIIDSDWPGKSGETWLVDWKTNESDPLFCDVVQKINRTDCKSQDLVVVLIDSHLLLLYADSLKLKSKMEIKDITGRISEVT